MRDDTDNTVRGVELIQLQVGLILYSDRYSRLADNAFSAGATLRGRRILIVEDSYLIAWELAELLECEGADVVGPVFSLYDARRLVRQTSKLDAAVLNVNLRGEMIWPVADILSQRRVRLVFFTGYAAAPIKRRYGLVEVAEKPAPARMVARLLLAEPSVASGL